MAMFAGDVVIDMPGSGDIWSARPWQHQAKFFAKYRCPVNITLDEVAWVALTPLYWKIK